MSVQIAPAPEEVLPEQETGVDLAAYLAHIPPVMLEHPESRRVLTEMDPLAFALLYLPHHLKGDATNDRITLSEFHVDLIEQAKRWVGPLGKIAQYRDAYIAPRECGKSTWNFLILPMWAAAHGHVKFIAAFADAAAQAEQHLQNFRHELDTNALLRADYPRLCSPAVRRGARQIADRQNQIQQGNGFVFMAKGVDSATLGVKIGSRRPDLIILDDIEPGESQYSPYQAEKRLRTIQDVILPLNAFARVVLVGTVTMAGSLIHQLVQSVTENVTAAWIKDENFRVHYYPAILRDEAGRERSIWPEKWPLATLLSMRGTRSFQKNFLNQPVADDGDYWRPEDITVEHRTMFGNTVLSIDPAVTTKNTSDYTGLAVVSRTGPMEVAVREALGVRLGPKDLRGKVLSLIEQYGVGLVYIETNQGGDLWHEILHDLPVKVKTVHQSDPKEVRAGRALNHYQQTPSRVIHTKPLPEAETQMLAFPRVAFDDVLDAVVSGVNYFLDGANAPAKKKAKKATYL